jgi:cell division protease FtsH
VTTGAQNDLERATQTARQMITEFGMSERLGPVTLGRKQHEVFLGRDIMEDRNYSEEIAFAIDQEVRRIIDECYDQVRALLIENRETLERITQALLEKEILEAEDLERLLQGDGGGAEESSSTDPSAPERAESASPGEGLPPLPEPGTA